jgi:HAD superfamily phosphatase (TIGR01681 family)
MLHYPSLKLVIFDLDETLHFCSSLYVPDTTRSILKFLQQSNVIIALASFNTSALYYLRLHKIDKYFHAVASRKPYKYPWQKHLDKRSMVQSLMNQFECTSSNTIFFDDLQENVDAVSSLGVTCIKVNKNYCLRWIDLFQGLQHFRPNIQRRYTA